jgi:hypothetical protein
VKVLSDERLKVVVFGHVDAVLLRDELIAIEAQREHEHVTSTISVDDALSVDDGVGVRMDVIAWFGHWHSLFLMVLP